MKHFTEPFWRDSRTGKDKVDRHMKSCGSILCMAAMVFLLSGCSLQGLNINTNGEDADTAETMTAQEQQKVIMPSNIYDSQDTAIVVKKDYEANTIQLQNIRTSRRYTLKYSGTTMIYDRYDEGISMRQLEEGSMVIARFYKENKALSYIKVMPDGVYYKDLKDYSIDLANGTFSTNGTTYNISGHVVVISDGAEADLMDVNQLDVLNVWGYDNMIYAINVEQGHGYLRLQNETYFLDGWLEVGDRIMRTITKDMLIVVPEGTFKVTVSNKGSSAMQEITFARNEEMAWDLGSVEITVVQTGTIIFTLTPVTAKVTIDGKAVNVAKPVELEYGLHKMKITADGYDTVAQYIRVAEPSASIDVQMEKSEEETETQTQTASEASSSESSREDKEEKESSSSDGKSKTDSSNDDNDEEDEEEESSESKSSKKDDDEDEDDENISIVSTDSDYRVYIDAPEGVEAYLNGNYIGITPLDFAKTAGNYVITLRKDGYQTRSYSLQIDSEKKDINYSFTELKKESGSDDGQ